MQCQPRLPFDHVQRRPLPGTGFGQHEGARGKVKNRQVYLAGRPGSCRLLPVKATGDHQVKDQEQLALQFPHDALAEAAETYDLPPLRLQQGRLHGPHQEGAAQLDPLNDGTPYLPLQGLYVDDDVGELRHDLYSHRLAADGGPFEEPVASTVQLRVLERLPQGWTIRKGGLSCAALEPRTVPTGRLAFWRESHCNLCKGNFTNDEARLHVSQLPEGV